MTMDAGPTAVLAIGAIRLLLMSRTIPHQRPGNLPRRRTGAGHRAHCRRQIAQPLPRRLRTVRPGHHPARHPRRQQPQPPPLHLATHRPPNLPPRRLHLGTPPLHPDRGRFFVGARFIAPCLSSFPRKHVPYPDTGRGIHPAHPCILKNPDAGQSPPHPLSKCWRGSRGVRISTGRFQSPFPEQELHPAPVQDDQRSRQA